MKAERLVFGLDLKASRVRLSDVNREVITEEGGTIKALQPADLFLTMGTKRSPVFYEMYVLGHTQVFPHKLTLLALFCVDFLC